MLSVNRVPSSTSLARRLGQNTVDNRSEVYPGKKHIIPTLKPICAREMGG